MSFTHYPFSSERAGWEKRQHIQKTLVVILQIHNSGTLAKITLNRISSWEDGWTSKRVNGNRRRWYAIKTSSWYQTVDVEVTCVSPTRTPTTMCWQSGVLEWAPLWYTEFWYFTTWTDHFSQVDPNPIKKYIFSGDILNFYIRLRFCCQQILFRTMDYL